MFVAEPTQFERFAGAVRPAGDPPSPLEKTVEVRVW
ncbi:hypothetical protein DSM3645_10712 [Blastopirellula marina DSM 3645]|uniref:Uncharacterized protein n=1 Tax=Blastopirellula marina DSM 3645 TaxID=314230 RepID=A3ZSN8_9BACT|nr:hypothetical protein DSM3645_10712 [Blastopirellula marina DSM 3645]